MSAFYLIDSFFFRSKFFQAITKNVDEQELHELHTIAQPLIETCSPIVVQQINESVRSAEIEWKDTNRNLHNLRDKYERALNLWQNYRDSSDAIKNWAADRMSTINVLKPLDANDIEVKTKFLFFLWNFHLSVHRLIAVAYSVFSF